MNVHLNTLIHFTTGLFLAGCNCDIVQLCQLWFTEDSSPSVAPEHRSLSHPRLAPGSPDSRLCRKLSPVEIYYEMRTRRNSASSSVRWVEGREGCFHKLKWVRFTLQLKTWMFIQPEWLYAKKCIQCGGQKCPSHTAVVPHCTSQCPCEVLTLFWTFLLLFVHCSVYTLALFQNLMSCLLPI